MRKIFSLFFCFTVLLNLSAQHYLASAEITDNSVRIRSKPSLTAEILALCNKGEIVFIIGRSDKSEIIDDSDFFWINIIKGNYTGWVYGKYLDNYHDYEWTEYCSTSSTVYQLKYPSIWKVNGSIFYDYNDHKIAELFGISQNNRYNKKYDEEEEQFIELINKDIFVLPTKQKVYHIVEKVAYSGGSPKWTGTWYPNTYILESNKVFFSIVFYEETQTETHKYLWLEILNTIKY